MSSSLWNSMYSKVSRCRARSGVAACVAHARGWRAANTSIDGHSLQATRWPQDVHLGVLSPAVSVSARCGSASSDSSRGQIPPVLAVLWG
eukprot:253651-Prorocentrum_minimum.AAC.1